MPTTKNVSQGSVKFCAYNDRLRIPAVAVMEYSKTSLSGHSEKRTHSLQRTMWQSRTENPVYVIH